MQIKNGKKQFINKTHVEGYLYDASKLTKKVTGPNSKTPGVEYIGGSIDIATNEELTNIVTVNFNYELPEFASGKKNDRYDTLAKIVDGTYKSVSAGKENALCLKIDSAVALNEYFSEKTGEKKLTSFKVNNGGYVHVITQNLLKADESERSTFEADVLINSVTVKEADPERNLSEKAILNVYAFDYNGNILPTTFDVTNPDAINYFVGLEASPSSPVLTMIKGLQINESVVKETEIEGAFGTQVKQVTSTNRSWLVNWAKLEPYELGDESTLTGEELQAKIAERNTYEATLSTQYDQRKSASAIPAAAATPAPAAKGKFNF